ncbi:helix-turn-helix domain-containing protein [Streptomyces sp. NPDC017949]|uniref:helix-turn-helix domain-containing protein n=1 Tax=Streptomyces sp. NPDC017949 TaxID=3365020 RepID=UPI0037A28AAF
MIETVVQKLTCGRCKQEFDRPKPNGRPPSFCSKICRSAAYRTRQLPARRISESHDNDVRRIAESLQAKANHAVYLARHPVTALPLDLVSETVRLQRDLDDLKAVAVRQAVEYGASWSDVAKTLSMVPTHARGTFNPDKVAKVLTWRANRGTGSGLRERSSPPARPSTDEAPSDASLPGHPGYQLATALSHLQRASGLSGRRLADELLISPSLLSRILLGKRTPKWRVVRQLAELCGADPSDLRPLWEKATGIRVVSPPSPQDYPRAARALQSTLRGMWLAAASPEPETLCRDGAFDPEQITCMLESDSPATHLNDWQLVARFAAALRGSPDDLRPLWEQMQAASQADRAATGPAAATLSVAATSGACRPNRGVGTPAEGEGTVTDTGRRPAASSRGVLQAWGSSRQPKAVRTSAGLARHENKPRPSARWDWIRRVVEVLHLLSGTDSAVTTPSIARAVGVFPADAAALMAWLGNNRLTTTLANGTHVQGPLLEAVNNGGNVLRWLLQRLSADTGAAVYISTYTNGEIDTPHSAFGPDTPTVEEYVAFAQSAHANAVGKALLAQLDPDDRLEHLTLHRPFALTAHTITDLPALFNKLDSVDRHGRQVTQFDHQEYSDKEVCAASFLTLPGQTGCVALSLPADENRRLSHASRILSDHSTGLLLSLILTLPHSATPPGIAPNASNSDTADVRPIDLARTRLLAPPSLRTALGDPITA